MVLCILKIQFGKAFNTLKLHWGYLKRVENMKFSLNLCDYKSLFLSRNSINILLDLEQRANP